MRYVSLFSGIEAASVAWGPLGWEPVCFAELDPFPSAVLAERYPSVPNMGDVTKVDWKKYKGKCDVVVGGSPCQSFSIAGKREGLSGESGLMFEYIRAVREIRPRWFLWENVPGALSSEGGEAFRQLLSEMDALGYGLAWRVLDAQFFGVAQRRERVFLVGHLGACPPVEVLFESEVVQWFPAPSREKRAQLAAVTRGSAKRAGFEYHGGIRVGFEEEDSFSCDTGSHTTVERPIGMTDLNGGASIDENMIGTLKASGGGHPAVMIPFALKQIDCDNICVQGSAIGRADHNGPEGLAVKTDGTCYTLNCTDRHAVFTPDTHMIRRLTPMECERLQGFPDNWTRIAWRGKPAEECPDGPRYKAIGNSMAVPVMKWIGKKIILAEEELSK